MLNLFYKSKHSLSKKEKCKGEFPSLSLALTFAPLSHNFLMHWKAFMDAAFIIGVSPEEFFLCTIFLLVASISINVFKLLLSSSKDNSNREEKTNIRSVFSFSSNSVKDPPWSLYELTQSNSCFKVYCGPTIKIS